MSEQLEAENAFIYKTAKAYKTFEDFFQEEQNRPNEDEDEDFHINEGYLIDKKYINYWKKFTDYEQIKDGILIGNKNKVMNIIRKNRSKNRLKEYQEDATQMKYYNPFSLYKSVKINGKSYALINKEFWKLICYDAGVDENGLIKYYFNDGRLILNFGAKGKLEIVTDDNIINETKEMFFKDTNNFGEDFDDNEENDLQLKKLILLYAYEQEIKNKINNLKFVDRNFKEYYLISKEWIEGYKRYYHYNELCNIINNKEDIRTLLNNGYENAKKNLEYIKTKLLVVRKKPKESFPQNLKDENTFLSEGSSVTVKNNSEVTFWKNFEIVNEELKNFLANSQENEYDIERASSAKGLISGGKLILDLSNDPNNEGVYALEIGNISNNDMIFKDEYIFQYDNEDDKNSNLNFIKDKFYLFQRDELNFGMNLKCNLYNEDGFVYGTAFKIPPHE